MSDSGALLKGERQRLILEELASSGRVVAAELQDRLGVSAYTVRRDLDELANAGWLRRVHGGGLPRSSVAATYEGRRGQGVAGKRETARAAATLLEPAQVAIVDGGSTALALVDAIPDGFSGTFVTHSPSVAEALGRHRGIEIVLIGGTLDQRAMVAVGAQTVEAYGRISADICFLGVWSLHAEHGLSESYPEEAEVRRVLLERADRVVALASRPKLGTVAPFGIGPATALTHIATERDVPKELLAPFEELGIHVVR